MSGKAQTRIKLALYVVVVLFALLLDEAAFGALGLRFPPTVIPIAVACIGLWEGADRGCIFGLLAGCLWAWSTRQSSYGAWCIVVMTLAGTASGVLSDRFLLQSWKTAFSISAAALVLTDGLYVIFLSGTGVLPGDAFFTLFLPEFLLSLVFVVFFYPATEYISRIGGFHG